MNDKTISIKIKKHIYETTICELTMYNLGINSSFEFQGLVYNITSISDQEVTISLDNNADYYVYNKYTELAKDISVTKENSIKICNIVKPTTFFEISIL